MFGNNDPDDYLTRHALMHVGLDPDSFDVRQRVITMGIQHVLGNSSGNARNPVERPVERSSVFPKGKMKG